ncbi:DNA mismatch repair endonuclease MutL [Acetobacteraceae bacterium H6797]|nr:DNA mismatch repair endonuclease MutL [Acetobacteraceae bacterium H6797]
MAIRLLPETTANRIAAGEVVERPAAAVKELVENALDAGATRITVTLEGGGIERILVEDDGAGMSAEDLALCVERHATSKLPEEEVLFRIATLGFRGEALPSIGAVARLSITSRRHDGQANQLLVEAGRKGEILPAAGAPGTRVEVRDLFFATPARRKFLRNPSTEASHAVAAVERLALAWPEVGFRVLLGTREVLSVAPGDRAARIAALLGADFSASAVPVEYAVGDLRLTGLAALPAYTKATTGEQHLVVNRRPVRDPLLRTALRVAYRDLIAAGRQPAAALFLDIDPAEVDVNVHPMKSELRFREAERVRGVMIQSLRRAISVGAGVAATAPALGRAWAPATAGDESRAYAPSFEPTPRPLSTLPLGQAALGRGFAETALPLRPPPSYYPLSEPVQRQLGLAPPPPAPEHEEAAPEPAPFDQPLGRPLAQVMETYILAEAPDGSLVLVDQHAAHERLTHEALNAQLVAGGVRSQPLLLPAVVDLPARAVGLLLDAAEELSRLGLDIESFGPGAVLVRALPALLGNPEPAPLLKDLAEELAEQEESTVLAAKLDAAVARLACHGSVRAGRRLNTAEMAALLRQMEATPRAATCSHGRPTFLKLDKGALERLFGRR